MSSRFQETQEDPYDKFNYEIVFHKMDMNYAPKNSVFSLTFKRGANQQESKRKFIFDDQSKQAIINEAFSFKTSLLLNQQNNQYKEKSVEVLVNHLKGEKSSVIGELRVNIAAYPNNNIYARYEQDVPLEKCNDLTARISFQIKCTKSTSRETSERRIRNQHQLIQQSQQFSSITFEINLQTVENKFHTSHSPIPGQISYQHQQQQQQFNGSGVGAYSQQPNKSYVYKRHQELSPVKPKSKQDDYEGITSQHLNEINANIKNLNEEQVVKQGNMSSAVVQTKAAATTTTNVKKQSSIITINKDKKQENKKFILINQKKTTNGNSNETNIKNTYQTTSQLSNSNISETTHANSDAKDRASIKQSSLHSSAAASKTGKNYSHLSSQSKSPEQSSKMTKNTLLTPRTKTPTPTPRPVSHISHTSSSTKNSSRKEIGYRERSQEQQEQKMQYNSKIEKLESQQKQQVPKQHKFIIEGKRLEEDRSNIKDIRNAELAEKLSSLTKKLRNDNQETREKDKEDFSDQSHNESNIEGQQQFYQTKQEIQDFKMKQKKEISNLDNMIHQMKTETNIEDFEYINGETERGENGYHSANFQKQSQNKKNNGQSNIEDVDEEEYQAHNVNHKNQDKQYQNHANDSRNNKSSTQYDDEESEFHEELQRVNYVLPQTKDLQIERKFTFNNQHQSEQQHRIEEKEKEWEQKLHTFQTEISSLNQTIQQLTVQNELLTNELSSTQQLLQFSNQEKLLSQIQEAANTPTNSQKDAVSSVENTQYMIQQIKIISSQNNELTNQVKQQQNTIFEYQTHLSEQEKKIEELSYKITQKDMVLAEKYNDVEALKHSVDLQIQSQVKIKEQQVDDVKSHYETQIKELLEQIRKSDEEKQIILVQFQMKQQEYEDHITDLSSQLEEANHRIDSLDKYYQLYENQGSTSAELDKALEKIYLLERKDQVHETEKQMLEEEIESLKQQISKNDILTSQANQRKIDIIQTEKDYLTQENSELKNKIEQITKQLKDQSLHIPMTAVKSDDFEEKYFTAQNTLRQVQTKLDLSKIELERQQIEYSKLQNILNIYSQKSDFFETANKELEIQLLETKEDLCVAMNGILGSQSNDIHDFIEPSLSFREIKQKSAKYS